MKLNNYYNLTIDGITATYKLASISATDGNYYFQSSCAGRLASILSHEDLREAFESDASQADIEAYEEAYNESGQYAARYITNMR